LKRSRRPTGDTTAPVVRLDRFKRSGRKLTLRVSCPAAETGGCTGFITLAARALGKNLKLGEQAFVALEGGILLAETDDLDVEPLADALEASIQPPYRAEAVRRGDGLWAVAARQIEVVDVPDPVEGDSVTIATRAGQRTVDVDGSRAFGSIPTLERLVGEDAVLNARRLDETLWEVEVTRL